MFTQNYTNQYNGFADNNKGRLKNISIGLLSLTLLVALGGISYRSYFSSNAQVNRLVQTYYEAQSKGDNKRLASLESKALKQLPGVTLAASTDAGEARSETEAKIVATKLGKKSGAITGRITTEDSKAEGTPFLATVVKEDGKWKINVFNVGLITKDDYVEGTGPKQN